MIVDIKLKGVWLKVDIEGISVGGGGWETTGTIATLTGAATLAGGGNSFIIDALTFFQVGDGVNNNLFIEPTVFNAGINVGDGTATGVFILKADSGGDVKSEFQVNDGTGNSGFSLNANAGDGYFFEFVANDGTNNVNIVANAQDNTIEHEAASHIFIGKMNNNTLQEFADDAAAVGGGLVPGDFYYTSDAGSGFLKVVLPAI